MNLADEIAALARRTSPSCASATPALFGEATAAKHRTWLVSVLPGGYRPWPKASCPSAPDSRPAN